MLEKQHRCFNEFPNECTECSEYRETRPDPAIKLVLYAGSAGVTFPQPYRTLVTKECKLYHKRQVEYAQ